MYNDVSVYHLMNFFMSYFETQAMIETLKISCIEEETEEEVEEELEVEVSAPIEKSFSKEEYAERVKTIFLSLVGEGYSPNEAGAKALIQANETIGLGSPSQEGEDKSKNDEKEEAEKTPQARRWCRWERRATNAHVRVQEVYVRGRPERTGSFCAVSVP